MRGRWTKIAQDERLKRSSHDAQIVGNKLYVLGGEILPRQPRDNDLYQVSLNAEEGEGRTTVTKRCDSNTAQSPASRVGCAMTTLGRKLVMFGGRGGEAMAPLEEEGSLWVFEPENELRHSWSSVKPPATQPYPQARSYHCMASDQVSTIYLHAGCPAKGRSSDLWAFDMNGLKWRKLSPAPDPPRGGASLAFAQGRLYRLNGFDGQTEQGGALDIYDPGTDAWSTINFTPDGKSGPGARSVSALLPVRSHEGTVLITVFGESDPSSRGHQGAGKMLDDVWSYSLQEKKWTQVDVESDIRPTARGWFASDVAATDGKDSVVIAGGLGESNERLDDVWTLSFE